MIESKRDRALAAVGIGIASAAAGIILSAVVITGYALFSRDASEIAAFAATAAEPLSLVGAVLVTVLGTLKLTRGKPRPARWGAGVGAAAAAFVAGAAVWTGDVDAWTAAAAVALPASGALAGWAVARGSSRPGEPLRPASERLLDAGSDLGGQPDATRDKREIEHARMQAPR